VTYERVLGKNACQASSRRGIEVAAFLRGGVLMGANELLRLSKSKFTMGLQCPKLLWWTVHEPD
jgi:hypothetical protein